MNDKRKITPWACIAPLALAMTLAACGGGGGGSSSSSSGSDTIAEAEARAFQVPSEISAVPVSSASEGGGAPGLATAVRSLMAAKALQDIPNLDGSVTVTLDESSDYMNAVPRKYIEIKALDEAFSIIGQIMSAMKQTRYWDDAVLNQGPYQAMVGWEDDMMGQTVKTVEKWTISSSYDADATNPYADTGVFTIQVWVPDEEVQGEYIRALFTLYKGATTDEETGEVTDFGVWDMNVKFNDDGSEHFLATAREVGGRSILKIKTYEVYDEGDFDFTFDMKAYLSRSADGTEGFGKVFLPMFNSQACGQGAGPPVNPSDCIINQYMPYAFNSNYLELGIDANGNESLEDVGDSEKILDRNSQAAITHRYGVFYAAATDLNGDGANDTVAGDNILKHKTFGFPVFADVSDGAGGTMRRYGFYGSWRGEHNLWGFQDCGLNGCSPLVSDGDTVTREDWSTGERIETTYTVDNVPALLAKREVDTTSVTVIKDTPVRVDINKHFDLVYDAGAWKLCKDGWLFNDQGTPTCQFMDFSQNPPQPQPRSLEAFDFDAYVATASRADGFVELAAGGQGIQVAYLTSRPEWMQGSVPSAGLYEVNFGTFPATIVGAYTPANGDIFRLNVTDEGWMVLRDAGASTTDGLDLAWKKLAYTGNIWEPEFTGTETTFTLPEGVNIRAEVGGNFYMVQLKYGAAGTAAADYLTIVENQTTYTPNVTMANFLPPNTAYLGKMENTNLRLSWDSDVLVLKVATGSSGEYTVGNTHETNEWSLVAYNADGAPLDADGNPAMNADGFVCMFPDQPGCSGGTAVQFMYRYDENGAAQTYLVSNGTHQLLSDQIALLNVPLVDRDGTDAGERTLRFDGFMMHGLPNLRNEFRDGDFDEDYLDKLLNVKYVTGKVTRVVGDDGVGYLIKPLETSVFMDDVSDEDAQGLIPDADLPNIDSAIALDLDTEVTTDMPDVADNTMGAVPSGDTVVVKFVEGVPVAAE